MNFSPVVVLQLAVLVAVIYLFYGDDIALTLGRPPKTEKKPSDAEKNGVDEKSS